MIQNKQVRTKDAVYNIRVDTRVPKNEVLNNSLSCYLEFWVEDQTKQMLYSRLVHRSFVSILDLQKVPALSISIVVLDYTEITKLLEDIYTTTLTLLKNIPELVVVEDCKFYHIDTGQNHEIYATMNANKIYSLVKIDSMPIDIKELYEIIKSYADNH